MLKDYGLDVQRLFLEMMLEDAGSYVRVQNIYNPQNFDRSLRPAAEFIKEHTDKFNKKMREHSSHFKQKFAELLEQQKNAQFPGK